MIIRDPCNGCREGMLLFLHCLQGLILLGIGFFLFHITYLGALLALVFIVLLAISFVSIGLLLGSFFESFEGFQAVLSFFLFPLFFLSGALFPVEHLPSWLATMVRWNPVTYAVDGLRGSTVGVHAHSYLLSFTILFSFCAVMVSLGIWAFRRMK